jgi:hypothetical protein
MPEPVRAGGRVILLARFPDYARRQETIVNKAASRSKRHLPPPWKAEKIAGGHVVRDANGHASRPDEWYDQDRAEWVVLMAGSAEAPHCSHAFP